MEMSLRFELAHDGPALGRILAGEGTAAEKIAELVVRDVDRQPLPEQEQYLRAAVTAGYAGAADLHRVTPHVRGKSREVEESRGVEAPVTVGHLGCLHSVAAYQPSVPGVHDHEVMTNVVVLVGVASGFIRGR
jgi:hypothetical protein